MVQGIKKIGKLVGGIETKAGKLAGENKVSAECLQPSRRRVNGVQAALATIPPI